MLRVTIQQDAIELRLFLEGRLAGPWVQEVELCWQRARSAIQGKTVIVDLSAVDYVDDDGERLLTVLHEHGAKLIACGPLTKHLVAEITGDCAEAPRGGRRSNAA